MGKKRVSALTYALIASISALVSTLTVYGAPPAEELSALEADVARAQNARDAAALSSPRGAADPRVQALERELAEKREALDLRMREMNRRDGGPEGDAQPATADAPIPTRTAADPSAALSAEGIPAEMSYGGKRASPAAGVPEIAYPAGKSAKKRVVPRE